MTGDSPSSDPQFSTPHLARPAQVFLARAVDTTLGPAHPGALPGFVHPMTLPQISAWRAAKHLLGLLLCFLGGTGVYIFYFAKPPEASTPGEALIATIALIGFVIAIAILLLHDAGVPIAGIGLTLRKFGPNLAIGLLTLVASFALFFATMLLMTLIWPSGAQQMQENTKNIDDMLPQWSPVAMLGVMFAVATAEETLFRGIILSHMRRLTRSWVLAVLGSSVVFAAMHLGSQQPAAAVALFPMAVLWSVLAILRCSVVPTIVAHALFNWLIMMSLIYTRH
jgi:membrane protease YdiL (CAAX protease family)